MLLAGGPAGAAAPLDAAAPVEPAAPATIVPVATPPAAGTAAADSEVAEHVAQGHRLYLLGHYQEAIAEYRRAYELRADPQFLLDTAEAYRQLGASDQALFYYERFLAAAPNAPNRSVVEDRVTELELLRKPVPGTGAALLAASSARAKPTPVWRRWWVWTAVGVALGAGITAAALANRSSSPAVPPTDLGDRKFYY